ncbi:hypothetical protein ACM25P_16620 [Vreelandella alkaliphila]|uniref:hypothetical protein n=1 Tax=Vreelandella alkaliphila TaxID=272774 RepID=UPI0039F5ADC7
MSLVVYVGIDKFKAESAAVVREQNVTEIMLSDIAKRQPNKDEVSTSASHLLMLETFSEEALVILKNWLKKDTKCECTIIWPQPCAWLAASLANRVGGEEALNDWLAQAKCLLTLFRSARRQVTLVGYLPGCELKTVKIPILDRPENTIYQLAAAYMCEQSQVLKDTYAYLTASSKECTGLQKNPIELVDNAVNGYLKVKDKEAAVSEDYLKLKVLKEENVLLTEQLHGVQEEVKNCHNENKKIKANILERDFERNEERARLEEESSFLLKQLNNVQSVYEKLSAEFLKNKRISEEQQSECRSYKEKLEKENSFLSEKLIAANNEFKICNDLNSKLEKEKRVLQKEVAQLNSDEREGTTLLLQQLHSIQEAYELLYEEKMLVLNKLNNSIKNENELNRSESDNVYLKKQLEKRQSEFNTLRTESEQRIHRLERLVLWLRVHAQRHASTAYRESRSYKKALPKQIAALEASPLFDAEWYSTQYPDIAQANIKPAEHFIKFGAIDGRHPGPLFSTEFYITHYEDVAASGQHPLLHYLRYGKEENREIHPPQYQLSALQTREKGAKA